MLQISKLIHSREEWRNKAVSRSVENKEMRKTHVQNKQKIADLRQQVRELQQVVEDTKKKLLRLERKSLT
jgi:TolA-binding protein